jgi:uncharacterized membrane protein YheB (UPF0754 family)
MLDMIDWKYVLIPVISAFIGWLTNWVAVKMLFHPQKPVKMGFFVLQGIFHRRQKEIAQKLGNTIESKLFSHADIYEILTSDKFVKKIVPVIERSLEDFIFNKFTQIHPFLTMVPETIFGPIKGKLIEVFEDIIPEIMSGAGDVLEDQINVKEIIRDKIENFDVSDLEDILFSILKSEFKMIEYIGGVLGFFIGITQLIVIRFF